MSISAADYVRMIAVSIDTMLQAYAAREAIQGLHGQAFTVERSLLYQGRKVPE